MAASDSSLGLKYFGMAPIPASGFPADEDFVEVGDTQTGNATFAETEPTVENVEIEQASGTYRTITTADGVITYTMSTYDVSPENLQALKGGTITPATGTVGQRWGMSRVPININRFIKIITLDDFTIYIPNGNVRGLFNFATQKGALGTLQVTVTVQTPNDATLAPIIVEAPLAAGA